MVSTQKVLHVDSATTENLFPSFGDDGVSENVPFVLGIALGEQGLKSLKHFFTNITWPSDVALVIFPCGLGTDEGSLLFLLEQYLVHRPRMAADGEEFKGGQTYVIPPWHPLALRGNTFFTLMPPETIVHKALDASLLDPFFASMAKSCGKRCCAVLMACDEYTDGSGVHAVRAAGGFSLGLLRRSFKGRKSGGHAMAQCDLVLPGKALAAKALSCMLELAKYVSGCIFTPDDGASLSTVYKRLRKVFRVDFSQYTRTAVLWRVARRMGLLHLTSLAEYEERLQHDDAEVLALADDILVGETRFFRDPESFYLLKGRVLAPLLYNSDPGDVLRAWVVGCSTGEEAYSLAILFDECMRELNIQRTVKIFATDVNAQSINVARRGVYPERVAADISPERLQRYFSKRGGEYHVGRELRKKCLFATHNVFSNPPFRGIDLVSYRHVHTYFQPALQQKVLSILHGALNGKGSLFLGHSERLEQELPFFRPLSEAHRIFTAQSLRRPQNMNFMRAFADPQAAQPMRLQHSLHVPCEEMRGTFLPQALDALHLGCAIVDADDTVQHLCGAFAPFFRLPRGGVSNRVQAFLSPSLALLVDRALKEVRATGKTRAYCGLALEGCALQRLTAMPLGGSDVDETGQVALFFAGQEEDARATTIGHAVVTEYDQMALLELQLKDLQSDNQRLRAELGAKVAELRILNEELQTANAEMRVTNEELQASNQELYATNKEMHNLNEQYGLRLSELQELNDDMDNCINATQVGSIFVDDALRVRKCTAFVSREFHLPSLESNMGLHEVEACLPGSSLVEKCRTVLRTLVALQCEVQDKGGKYYMLRVAPYHPKDGGTSGLVIALVDIQELKQAYARIDVLSYAMANLPASMLIADEEGVVRYVNPCFSAMSGYTAEDVCGHSLASYMNVHMEDSCYVEAWAKVQQGESWSGEIQCLHKDGSTYWERLSLLPVINHLGETTAYLKVCENVSTQRLLQLSETEYRKHLEEMVQLRTADLEKSRNEAQCASRAKSTFLSTVSHEIRTPMNAIIGFTHIFERNNLSEQQRGHLEKIQMSAETLLGIINDVLDISKIEAGKLELDLQPFDLHQVLDTVRGIMEATAEAKGLTLDVRVGEDVPALYKGDGLRVNQILMNLLNNAVKFTHEGGVVVTVERCAGAGRGPDREVLRFAVQDSGIGISKEQLPRLFQSFSQADGSITRRFGGTGLGLAICKELVQLMGGHIGVTSTQGQGTVFHFTLVLSTVIADGGDACTEKTAMLPACSHLTSVNPLAGKRVLLVEDNDLNQEIATALLEEYQLQVDCAATGLEALEKAALSEYACILMDMQMPVMGGLEATEKLRVLGAGELPWLATVPIIAMTANALAEDRQLCFSAGMNEHIGKPIDPAMLREVLFRFIGSKGA